MTVIYYIGGSPCSGKSTVAEMISNKFNMYYFKVDEFLFSYIEKAKKDGKPFSEKSMQMSADEMWLRDPMLQCEEEIAIYKEILEYAVEDLNKIQAPNGIITEGAAYLPELMNSIGIDKQHYLCVVPTKEFQYFHYRQRPWVPKVLDGCSDKEAAFENWMQRDVLFSMNIKQNAENFGYKTFVTDGSMDAEHTYERVCKAFGLS